MTRPAKRPTRREKQAEAHGVELKQKKPSFQEERDVKVQHIQPMNDRQEIYLESIDYNQITVARGSAGTGKTFLAAKKAANAYLKGEVKKIVVMRPLVGMGKGSGFWPGTIQDKLEPWLTPILNVIKQTIGAKLYEAEYGKSIVIQPMEAVRGMSFDSKTFLIIDEAQNCTPEEIRSLVTRLEEGTKCVLCGDDKQKDVGGTSGIIYLDNLIRGNTIPSCAVIRFEPQHSVRSGLTRIFTEIFETEGPAPK